MNHLALEDLTATVSHAPGLILMNTNFRVGLLLKTGATKRHYMALEPLTPCCSLRISLKRDCPGCFDKPLPEFIGGLLTPNFTLDEQAMNAVVRHAPLDALAREIVAQKISSWFEPFLASDMLTWPRRGVVTLPLMEL